MTKPFGSLPGPRGLPILGTLPSVLVPYVLRGRLHALFQRRRRDYGLIYKEQLGPYSAVYINDPRDIEVLAKAQGRYPRRTQFEAWKLHRQATDYADGLVLSEGKDWQRCRSAFNRPLMQLDAISKFSHELEAVADDLCARIRHFRDSDGEYLNIRRDLFLWSLESGCCVLFGRRLGCLSDNKSEEIEDFIHAVETMFWSTERLLLLPATLAQRYQLPVWRKHARAWDILLRTGDAFVRPYLDASRSHGDDGLLIRDIASTGTLSPEELVACLVDLMIGAVDTTSNTMYWCLYLLARYPSHQERLYHDIALSSGRGSGHNVKPFADTPSYVKAVIKEVLRFVPVAPMLARILPQDTVIRDFSLPAGTLVNVPLCSMTHDPRLFQHADSFLPDRWMRMNDQPIHPYAYLPFGLGTRSCIGRRLAELEMYILLSKISMQFHIQSADGAAIDSKMRVLLTPASPARLRFVDRTITGK